MLLVEHEELWERTSLRVSGPHPYAVFDERTERRGSAIEDQQPTCSASRTACVRNVLVTAQRLGYAQSRWTNHLELP